MGMLRSGGCRGCVELCWVCVTALGRFGEGLGMLCCPIHECSPPRGSVGQLRVCTGTIQTHAPPPPLSTSKEWWLRLVVLLRRELFSFEIPVVTTSSSNQMLTI